MNLAWINYLLYIFKPQYKPKPAPPHLLSVYFSISLHIDNPHGQVFVGFSGENECSNLDETLYNLF